MPKTRSGSSRTNGMNGAPRSAAAAAAAIETTLDEDDSRSPLASEIVRGLKLVHDLRGSLGAVLLMLDLAARAQPVPAQQKRIEGIASALRAACDGLTDVSALLVSGGEATNSTLRRHDRGLGAPDA